MLWNIESNSYVELQSKTSDYAKGVTSMQPDSINSIIISDTTVYFSSCPGGSTSSNDFRYEVKDYTNLLRKHGLESMLAEIAYYALNNDYYIENSSLWCRLLDQVFSRLSIHTD